jgi:8-oxo-dGTP pyrophosphatase MutT (NUDIX family)
MSQPDAAAFYAGISYIRAAAGALITDGDGRVLIVEPTYKSHWEVPGGVIDQSETPSATCRRECREELGLDIAPGRLLVIEYQTDGPPRGDSVMFIFDGGVLTDTSTIRVAVDELKSFGFFTAEEFGNRLSPKLARRMTYSLDALATGRLIELENGILRS